MISIIGGGPSGAYLGSLLGKECRIFEEHNEIGNPTQCTGILTHSIHDLISVKKDFVVNKINKIRLISPGNVNAEFRLRNPEIIVDRRKFDKHLVDLAKDKGAEVYLNHKLKNYSLSSKGINLNFGNKILHTDVLVGADGPNSVVARGMGMNTRKYKVGHQYVVRGEFEKDVFEVYFNGVKNYFGWVVPESEKLARIGILGSENIPELFKSFLNKIGIDKGNFIECQSGVIPVYDYSVKRNMDNVYLVGDAAGFVKATTLGGIVYGMRSCEILDSVFKNGGDYDSLLRKNIGKELWLHSKAAEFLSGLGKDGWDDFVKLLKKIELGKFNRDKPFSGLHLFLKPELIYFLSKHFLKTNLLRNRVLDRN